MTPNFLYQLEPGRPEHQIEELKPGFTDHQAALEAARCLYCHDAPCTAACPSAVPVPEFIRRIASRNLRGAARAILEANILGLSCARVCPTEVLCEGACVLPEAGQEPIDIGRLQRYAVEWAYEHNAHFFAPAAPTGKKVALVGAGPASLACAAELARLGHRAILFEAKKLPGGLSTTGVAPYKMRAEVALREVEYVQQIGMEIRTGVRIGEDVTFTELEHDFDAIFLGVGLGRDATLRVPGEEMEGCVGAVTLIEQLKTSPSLDLSGVNTAAVIGGGNTALDAARGLKMLGVARVMMVYRRTKQEMPAYSHELEYALKEGVELSVLTQPVAIEGPGRVKEIHCVGMELGTPDDSGRRRPLPRPGSEHVIKADMVVEAVGQEKLLRLLEQIPDLRLEDGLVAVDEENGQTSNPRYFAGGDCVNGGREVVHAAAEGKRAARGIHCYLEVDHGKP